MAEEEDLPTAAAKPTYAKATAFHEAIMAPAVAAQEQATSDPKTHRANHTNASTTTNHHDSRSYVVVLQPSTTGPRAVAMQPNPIHTAKPQSWVNCLSLSINNSTYAEHLKIVQYSLIARIILTKGDKPWKLVELRAKLQTIWQLQ